MACGVIFVGAVFLLLEVIFMDTVLHPKFIYDEDGNKIEAIISIEEYEKLEKILDLIEHSDIYRLIKEREATPDDDYLKSDEMLSRLGINENEI
jgi:Mn-dependent DtxR family transcriptional regulator